MRALFFLQYIFLFLLVHNSEFFRKPNQELLYQTTFWCGLVLNAYMTQTNYFLGYMFSVHERSNCEMSNRLKMARMLSTFLDLDTPETKSWPFFFWPLEVTSDRDSFCLLLALAAILAAIFEKKKEEKYRVPLANIGSLQKLIIFCFYKNTQRKKKHWWVLLFLLYFTRK